MATKWSLIRRGLVLVLGSLALVIADEPKGVSVSLRVKWPGTSILLEAAEFLVRLSPTPVIDNNSPVLLGRGATAVFASLQASQNPSAFWAFVDSWQEPNHSSDGSCWDAIRTGASQHLSSGTALALQQAMASRQFTAKVEMLRNLPEPTQVHHLHLKDVLLHNANITRPRAYCQLVAVLVQRLPKGSWILFRTASTNTGSLEHSYLPCVLTACTAATSRTSSSLCFSFSPCSVNLIRTHVSSDTATVQKDM